MSHISAAAQARQDEARDSAGRFGEQERTPEEASLPAPLTDADMERAFRDIQGFARMYSARYRFDPETRDDIVQDTIVDVLAQQRRGKTHVADRAFLNNATGKVASRFFAPDEHHTALAGRRKLKERLDAYVQEHGSSSLSTREINRLAEEVRTSYPVGRRPPIGYHEPRRVASLDQPAYSDDASTTLGDTIADNRADRDSGFATSKSWAANTLDSIDDDRVDKKEVRDRIWDIISEDGPQVVPDAVPDDVPVREHIEAAGGPLQVATRWENGEATAADEQALFAPFGDPTEHEREQIAGTIRRHGDYADRLWGSALAQSVNRAERTRRRAAARRASTQGA